MKSYELFEKNAYICYNNRYIYSHRDKNNGVEIAVEANNNTLNTYTDGTCCFASTSAVCHPYNIIRIYRLYTYIIHYVRVYNILQSIRVSQ